MCDLPPQEGMMLVSQFQFGRHIGQTGQVTDAWRPSRTCSQTTIEERYDKKTTDYYNYTWQPCYVLTGNDILLCIGTETQD